jgi:ABC-type uncharacterized transport system substrate-binding protein
MGSEASPVVEGGGGFGKRTEAYVDRILKGERPGDLPVQSLDKFELVSILKQPKLLVCRSADSFLLLADEVIE